MCSRVDLRSGCNTGWLEQWDEGCSRVGWSSGGRNHLGQLVEVLFHVFKDHEQMIILSDHFLEFHNIGVAELP